MNISVGAIVFWGGILFLFSNPVKHGEWVLNTILGVIYLVLRLFGLA